MRTKQEHLKKNEKCKRKAKIGSFITQITYLDTDHIAMPGAKSGNEEEYFTAFVLMLYIINGLENFRQCDKGWWRVNGWGSTVNA